MPLVKTVEIQDWEVPSLARFVGEKLCKNGCERCPLPVHAICDVRGTVNDVEVVTMAMNNMLQSGYLKIKADIKISTPEVDKHQAVFEYLNKALFKVFNKNMFKVSKLLNIPLPSNVQRITITNEGIESAEFIFGEYRILVESEKFIIRGEGK